MAAPGGIPALRSRLCDLLAARSRISLMRRQKYFALSVRTTFGTTDVTVMSRELRRTVAANATIAFVFNTVIVAGMVAALDGGQGA
ncbi:UNVERIFIED_CONTAM: hypothetical protein RKD43_006516 [Streptomyces graminofaciens]